MDLGGNNVDVKGNGKTHTWHAYIKMELVGKGVDPLEGENGYASATFVQKGANIDNSVIRYVNGDDNLQNANIGRNYTNYMGQDFRDECDQLNRYWFPQDLKPYLRNVIKYTEAVDPNNIRVSDFTSIEAIWVPSLRELMGSSVESEGYTNYGAWGAQYTETLGPVYDSYYTKLVEQYNSDDNKALRKAKNESKVIPFRSQHYSWYVPYSNHYGTWIINGDGEFTTLIDNWTDIIIGFCV